MNSDTVEFRYFESDLVTVGGILPAASMDLFLQLNEPGSGTVKIPLKSRAAGYVDSGGFAEGKYRGAVRGGFFVENLDKAHAVSGENAAQWMTISGRGALALLDDGIVWDDGTSATTRNLTGTKAGMLITLIAEAQARGALSNLTYNFTAILDSVGVAWADNEALGWSVGTSLLDVARQMAKRGIDFDITPSGTGSFVLSAYKNGKGTDKSETVYFRVGVNCEEVSSLEAGGDVRNAMRIAYKAGYTGVSDSGSIALRRRREKLLDARNAQTYESARTYGVAELEIKKNPKTSITVKVYDGVGPRAFLDYVLGDTITLDIKGVEATYRVRGMQLSWDGKKFADVLVDLNSIIDENEIRVTQDVDWLLDQWQTAHDSELLEVRYWAALSNGASDNVTSINALHIIGDKLYVGGVFSRIGGCDTINFAVYNLSNGEWTSPSLKFSAPWGIRCFASIGTDLYIGGRIVDVLKYDTLTDTYTVGAVLEPDPLSLLASDVGALLADGDDLYITGFFQKAATVTVNNITRLDTTTGVCYNMDGGITTSTYGGSEILSLTGLTMLKSGSTLYIGGNIESAGTLGAVSNIISWNGTSYSDLDGGLDGFVHSLALYGTDILAGGRFTNYLQFWDGAAWAVFAGGANDNVRGLAVYLTDVYAVGDFTDLASHIAKYSGGEWFALESGLNDDGYAVTLYNDDVYVGGVFTEAGDKPTSKIAAYFTNFQSMADYLENSSTGSFDMGAAIHNAPASAITDSDEVPFWEDVANALRKITFANFWIAIKAKTDLIYVALIGDQTVAGIKTFSASPIVPTPTTDMQASTKKYVDDNIGGGGTPGGSDTQVQYNNGGAFGGAASHYYDDALGIVYLGGAGSWDVPTEDSASTVLSLLAPGNDLPVISRGKTWADAAYTTAYFQTRGYRARGTRAAPSAVGAGDKFIGMQGFGFDGTAWLSTSDALVYIRATETFTTSAHGAEVVFDGTPAGSVTREEFGKAAETGFDLPAGRDYRVGGVPHTHALPSWTAPTLINSWANIGGSSNVAGYAKDTIGNVHLKGIIRYGSVPSTAFTLPIGYRPPVETFRFGITAGGLAYFTLKTDGSVEVTTGNNTFISLDGVQFETT